MTVRDKNAEQRQSFRCPVSGARQEGELKVGEMRMPARVLNESAGGFAVLVDGPPGVEAGALVQLRTNAAWFEAKVASIIRIEPPKTENEAEEGDATGGPTFRLGLCRLGDIASPDEENSRSVRRSLLFHLAQFFPSGPSMAVTGVVFAILVVLAPMIVVLLLSHRDNPVVKEVSKWGDGMIFSQLQESDGKPRPQAAAARSSAPRNEAPPSPEPARARDQPATSASAAETDGDELLKRIRDLPGAMAFVLPDVIGRLELTQTQQDQIERIVQTTARALQDLDVFWPGASRQELSQKRSEIFEQAHRGALDTLTEEQRTRWQELADEAKSLIPQSLIPNP
jgi:hypothetical protein